MLYPEISSGVLTVLRVLREQMDQHPDYLTHPDCKYGAEIKELLRRMAPKPVEAKENGDGLYLGETGGKLEILERKAEQEYRELEDMDLEDATVGEKIQYHKAKTVLLEKLYDIVANARDGRMVTEFTEAVLRSLEDELDGDLRDRVLARLRSVATHDR